MKSNNFSLKNFLELIFFCLLGLIPRLILLNHNEAGIESDEAIIGLMGKHILENGDFPIFYYGQAYMGSLEAMLTAVSFKLFGISNLSLKLVPLIFSIILIAINYFFGFVLLNTSAARVSALLTAIAPSPLIVWSLKARGGFIETVVIGSLCLLFTHFVIKEIKSLNSLKINKNIAWIGFFAGLGWWTNNQIIYYYPSVALGVIAVICKLPTRKLISAIFRGIGTFLIGGAPFWYHNIVESPRWSTFEVLFGKTAGSDSTAFFIGYWETALPIILGARKFWSASDIFVGANIYAYLTYSLVAIFGFFVFKSQSHQIRRRDNTVVKLDISILILFLIIVPIIFSLSSFGWLSQAPRYLLPLYSVLPLFTAYCLGKGFSSDPKSKTIAGILLASILTLNLASNYSSGIADEGQPMLYRGERVAKDHSELYSWLINHGYHHVYTNYWIGYRMAFETNERITFSVFGNPRTVRIPEYQSLGYSSKGLSAKSDESLANRVFVLSPLEANEVYNFLRAMGYCARTHSVGKYRVIDSVVEKYPAGNKIQLHPKQFRSFIPPDNSKPAKSAIDFASMLDNDLTTRWGSGEAQSLGMAIEIDFPSPTNLQRIVLRLGNYLFDAPRYLNVSGIQAKGGERIEIFSSLQTRVASSGDFFEILPNWDIRFNPAELSMLRLELVQSSPVFDWSIAEIELFSAPKISESSPQMCDY